MCLLICFMFRCKNKCSVFFLIASVMRVVRRNPYGCTNSSLRRTIPITPHARRIYFNNDFDRDMLNVQNRHCKDFSQQTLDLFLHSQISSVLYFAARPEQGRGITKYPIVNNFHTLLTRFCCSTFYDFELSFWCLVRHKNAVYSQKQ